MLQAGRSPVRVPMSLNFSIDLRPWGRRDSQPERSAAQQPSINTFPSVKNKRPLPGNGRVNIRSRRNGRDVCMTAGKMNCLIDRPLDGTSRATVRGLQKQYKEDVASTVQGHYCTERVQNRARRYWDTPEKQNTAGEGINKKNPGARTQDRLCPPGESQINRLIWSGTH
jgi:hypothetical protein